MQDKINLVGILKNPNATASKRFVAQMMERCFEGALKGFEIQRDRIKELEARIKTLEAAAGIEHKAVSQPLLDEPPQPGEVVTVGDMRFKYLGERRWRAVQ
jgi:hypothetical protein